MKFISRIKTTVRKATKRIGHRSISSRDKSSGAVTLSPSPGATTLPFHNSGTSRLPAATTASYSNIFPSSCSCHNCATAAATTLPAQAGETPRQPQDNNLTPTAPQFDYVVPAVPFHLPSELTRTIKCVDASVFSAGYLKTHERFAIHKQTLKQPNSENPEGACYDNPKSPFYMLSRKFNTRAQEKLSRMVSDYVLNQLALAHTTMVILDRLGAQLVLLLWVWIQCFV